MGKINKLTAVLFIFNMGSNEGAVFAVNIIVQYESGRIFQQTYYEERDIPLTYRDYMRDDWCISENERSKPGEYLRQYVRVYQRGD